MAYCFAPPRMPDVAKMEPCRLNDAAGHADNRMAAYFRGEHHPQLALMPRTGFIALLDGAAIGYIAGHLTTRHGCQGEVQYLFVASSYRRRGDRHRLDATPR